MHIFAEMMPGIDICTRGMVSAAHHKYRLFCAKTTFKREIRSFVAKCISVVAGKEDYSPLVPHKSATACADKERTGANCL